MGTRNDDISLILAKAKKNGFLPDVADSEVDMLQLEASSMFNKDTVISNSVNRRSATGQGAVVITMDDGYKAMRTVAEMMNARGQKGTFCITPDLMNNPTTKIVDSDILYMDKSGHEIAAHSKTHANMTSITQAERVVEYDYPKTYLEALIGKPVTTWAYPFGTGSGGRNTQCDIDIYLRYDRLLDTAVGTQNIIYPKYNPFPPFLINRNAWATDNHQQIMTSVKRAKDSAVLVPIFFHNLDTAINPTTAQVIQLLDYCYDNNIPCITTSEAFPKARTVINAGFEEPLVDAGINATGWRWFHSGTGANEQVTETPDAYLPGTKSLHLVTTDTSSYSYVQQAVQVIPGHTYTFSFRTRVVSGTQVIAGKCYGRIKAMDYGQTVQSGYQIKTRDILYTTDQAWTKISVDFTAAQDTRTVLIELVLDAAANGARVAFDHVYFEHKSLGDLG